MTDPKIDIVKKGEVFDGPSAGFIRQPSRTARPVITAAALGDRNFKSEYNLKYAYVAGGMYRGIASEEMVIKLARAGCLGFFGTGGLKPEEIKKSIQKIRTALKETDAFGMNLLSTHLESELIDLFLAQSIRRIEAAAFMRITPALVKFRLKGLEQQGNRIQIQNRIMAKVSRPEVAEMFLSPPPEAVVRELLSAGLVSAAQAESAAAVPMADDLCIEADSGGHTDKRVAYALMPAMVNLRDRCMQKYQYAQSVRIGAAGGIGTPEAAAAAFILGADFILTGSINQCTVEAGTSPAVKEILQSVNVQDTDYAPAGDMFEMGALVQVVKKGLFFPARANKLYQLFRQHSSLDEIDEHTKKQVQEKYFKKNFAEIYEEAKTYYPSAEIEAAERNPKKKMGLIFRWYFGHASDLALRGDPDHKVDYQIHCGPALGAFNQWVKGTAWEEWTNRHVDEIAVRLMKGAATVLNRRFEQFTRV